MEGPGMGVTDAGSGVSGRGGAALLALLLAAVDDHERALGARIIPPTIQRPWWPRAPVLTGWRHRTIVPAGNCARDEWEE